MAGIYLCTRAPKGTCQLELTGSRRASKGKAFPLLDFDYTLPALSALCSPAKTSS